ncbi:asparagine synthase-related protein [Tenacibaculum sp. 190524A05c]|uniref:asparagine synthase-related protein n=1 Tax=Tenacibaculum platacis TaxID=3137852 RepID=UPI0032B10FFB
MSDFLFINKKIQKDNVERVLLKINSDYKEVYTFSSEKATLCMVKNHYNGFDVYENEDHVLGVIGGPILNYSVNSFITIKNNNEGSKLIYKRWIKEKQMEWDEDLSGPFVIILFNKKTSELRVVTDMLSFIPVYHFDKNDTTVVSTHIEMFDSVGEFPLDLSSMAEFITHEVVTFPFTVLKDVYQLNSATLYVLNSNFNEKDTYWIPKENKEDDLGQLSKELKNSFQRYISKILEAKPKLASFLSGGEDSRVIASSIPKEYPIDSYLFTDSHNIETEIAAKVAKSVNANLKIHLREKTHYWEMMPNCVDLIGANGDFAHVHTYGFHKTCNFENYDVILGGFLSDTLLKGHHIKKKKRNQLLSFLPLKDKKADTTIKKESAGILSSIKPKYIEIANQRRKKRADEVASIRKESFVEWFNIYPITMHNDVPNIWGNRRLFRSFEPFTDSKIVKIAAKCPQQYKLNKKLFYAAMKDLYKPTKWIFHNDDYLPSLPYVINKPISFFRKAYFKIIRMLLRKERNKGSWSNWNNLISLDYTKDLEQKYSNKLLENIGELFVYDEKIEIINNPNFSTRQKRLLIQLGYFFSKK